MVPFELGLYILKTLTQIGVMPELAAEAAYGSGTSEGIVMLRLFCGAQC